MVVVVEKIVARVIGNVDIRISVVVVIRRHNCFGERDLVHAGRVRDVNEGAVALIQEKLRRTTLASHEQIEPAVVIDVGPNRGLRGGRRLRQTSFAGHVCEGTVTVAAQ